MDSKSFHFFETYFCWKFITFFPGFDISFVQVNHVGKLSMEYIVAALRAFSFPPPSPLLFPPLFIPKHG